MCIISISKKKGHHKDGLLDKKGLFYLAYATALVSLITVILICPG